ncbi:MAG: tetratricopeptide repeat protein [Sandaracinaceae bacterium]|nr:tetratricopeptide repeat protein [Sandaracinaceae bacterium]
MGATLARIGLTALLFGASVPASAQPARGERAGAARAARLISRGEAYLAAGDRGSAIGYFREAIDADPLAARAYLRLGEAYRERGSLDDARAVLEAGLERAPDEPALWLALAGALLAAGDLDAAAAAVRGLLERRPDHAEAMRLRAELARERGAWSEALTAYRARLASPASPEEAAEALRHERALRILARPLDPVSAPRACEGSAVRRALARCR